MKRAFGAVVGAALLVAMLPGLVSAARISKFTDHFVSLNCDTTTVDGDYVRAFLDHGTFGGGAGFDIWLAPAVPFEEPSSITGFTETDLVVTDTASGVEAAAAIQATDQVGTDLGVATLSAVLVPVGDPFQEPPPPKSNHHSATQITHQPLKGSATLTLDGTTYELLCGGEILDFDVFEANPTSFVASNAGTSIACTWETEDSFTAFFAIHDAGGVFADVVVASAAGEAFTTSWIGSIDAAGLDFSLQLQEAATGDPLTATASATFDPIGDPVTSIITQQNSRQKLIEQALEPDGSLDVSTGESFTLDTEHCAARTFASHFIFSSPKGPKSGPVPSNDTPDGAIAVSIGSQLNAQTTGTVLEAEVPITTCPEGDRDNLGHTLWYTFEGTGDPVTIDTSGSNFDTVVAVYTRDGDAFTEVGCEDDVAFEPVGASFQAVLTVDTGPGVTYWVQAGGFRRFDSEFAEAGRLRLAID
jgi:hypothetical protein